MQVCIFYLVLRALDTVGEREPLAFEFVLPRGVMRQFHQRFPF